MTVPRCYHRDRYCGVYGVEPGFGFRVFGPEFRVSALGFRVSDAGFWDLGFGFRGFEPEERPECDGVLHLVVSASGFEGYFICC